MLFNSFIYIFLFLPLVVVAYHVMLRLRLVIPAKVFLVVASLFFYSWWNWSYLPILLISIAFNYALGEVVSPLERSPKLSRKLLLAFGITMNVAALGFYKYADFFLTNLNHLAQSDYKLLELALPLAISFFTFQQIAYLVDSYQGKTLEYNFLNYCLFVSFFPQLIAGPIVHHREMMVQFMGKRAKVLSWKNIYWGLFVFSLGLFKKVFVADSFSVWANAGYADSETLGFIEAWCTSLSYTMQIYYDFSGYTDMAIGAALLFNIHLPQNFNSPYKALNIQDFWHRWHMTLSRWLRDYIYIPIGGNRCAEPRVMINLFTTFCIGGLWHGASWTFVIWGALHGGACMLHRLWMKLGLKIPKLMAWALTFLFINLTWVFFRADSLEQAWSVIKAMSFFDEEFMAHLKNLSDYRLLGGVPFDDLCVWIGIFSGLAFLGQNSCRVRSWPIPERMRFIVLVLLFLLGAPQLNQISEFLYFNF
ncbi:MBOAT family O-acyltransferase [Coraliomargarita parva]|uniref:MBOAT family O-acyltransferase n=1 Tax=Coraliomargarita parva TaxID=3014050 RepID=UPI0022B41B05|nr:MBOAT family protein [Coraliomargarita parva]